jgi:hypothetical protein
MSRIGTFSKEMERNPTEIDFDGVIAKWDNNRGFKITILVQKDWAMEKPEYWVGFEYEDNAGGGPDLGWNYGTKRRAYDQAYEVMRKLTEEPERFQEFIV